MALHGIIPVTVTPMNVDGTSDYGGHKRYIEHLLKHPIGGLWALGSAGENFLMTYENRIKTAEILMELVGDQVPIIMGAAAFAMDDIFRFFEETCDMPFYGYHVIPGDGQMKHKALLRYYTMLADHSPKPLWLYHNWVRGAVLPVQTVRELSQHPNISGLKAGGSHLGELMKFADMDCDDFQVVGAGGGQTFSLLSLGLKAHTASPASCFPGIICRIYSLMQEGNISDALDTQKRFNRVWGQLPWPEENSETSAHEKAILEVMGICQRHVSIQFRENTDEEMDIIRKLMPEFEAIEQSTSCPQVSS